MTEEVTPKRDLLAEADVFQWRRYEIWYPMWPRIEEPPISDPPVIWKDHREFERAYRATIYRPRKWPGKPREMVPGDLGLDSWPSTS